MSQFETVDGEIYFNFDEDVEVLNFDLTGQDLHISSTQGDSLFFSSLNQEQQTFGAEETQNIEKDNSSTKKKTRNNQNHVRSINRKILKKSSRTYKIHKPKYLEDKRVTIALCRLEN